MVSLLLENGAEPNLQVDRSDTLLGQAIGRGAPEIVQELLDHKADPNFNAGIPPLIKALDARGPATRQMVSLLLEHDADANLPGMNKTTPLMFACLHPDEEIVSALLARKADVNAQDKDGRSALWYLMNRASEPNALAVARQLLAAGADVNLKDDKGQSVLTMQTSGEGAAKLKALFESQAGK
jgi:ankyrin repeat protein